MAWFAHAGLGPDGFVVAMAATHPRACGTGPVRLDQRTNEAVLLLNEGQCFRAQALELCRKAGADDADSRGISLAMLAQMKDAGAAIVQRFTSKRSSIVTFVHALMKSWMKRSSPSAWA